MLWVSEVEFCPAWKCCKLLTNTCRQNLSKHYMKGGLNIKTNNILLRNFPAHHLIWTLIKLLKMFCFKQCWYNFLSNCTVSTSKIFATISFINQLTLTQSIFPPLSLFPPSIINLLVLQGRNENLGSWLWLVGWHKSCFLIG